MTLRNTCECVAVCVCVSVCLCLAYMIMCTLKICHISKCHISGFHSKFTFSLSLSHSSFCMCIIIMSFIMMRWTTTFSTTPTTIRFEIHETRTHTRTRTHKRRYDPHYVSYRHSPYHTDYYHNHLLFKLDFSKLIIYNCFQEKAYEVVCYVFILLCEDATPCFFLFLFFFVNHERWVAILCWTKIKRKTEKKLFKVRWRKSHTLKW